MFVKFHLLGSESCHVYHLGQELRPAVKIWRATGWTTEGDSATPGTRNGKNGNGHAVVVTHLAMGVLQLKSGETTQP